MKAILEYLNANIKLKTNEFPSKPKIDDITKFLEKHGFECINNKINPFTMMRNMEEFAKTSTKPIYVNFNANIRAGGVHSIILFCNNGEINENNPIFKLYATDTGVEGPYFTISGDKTKRYYLDFNDKLRKGKRLETYEEFIEETNKYFDW